MHLDTHLAVDVLAHETDEQLSVLLELTAPPLPTSGTPRPPHVLQVVLDRSGSMGGERLDAARAALHGLVDRLGGTDVLGVVAFSDSVDVPLPAGPLGDKRQAHRAVDTLRAGGSTNLSGGLLRGLQEAERARGRAGSTLLLLSDGHANAGVTDPGALAEVCATARAKGVRTSATGIGLGYDERLLGALAEGGGGDLVFAESADGAARAVAGQVEGLVSQVAQAASLLVRMGPQVRGVVLHNDLPAHAVEQGLQVELGELFAEEQRKVLLTFDVPAVPALGLATVAELELTWVQLPELVQHTVTVPVQVNVVPGDEAAGRVARPEVEAERLVLDSARARRSAAERLAEGDVAGAHRLLAAADLSLSAGVPLAPAAVAADLAEQSAQVHALLHDLTTGRTDRAAKSARTQSHMTSRKRGRRQPDGDA